MKFFLIYDKAEKAISDGTLLPLLDGMLENQLAFDQDDLPEIPNEARLLLYLSDIQIKTLLPLALKANALLSALPHPSSNRFCQITGVAPKLEKAVEHLKNPPDSLPIDMLYCNERPVFSSVVVGATFELITSKFNKSIRFWKRKLNFLSKLRQMRPFRLDIVQKNDHKVKAAVIGMVITTHKSNSNLSRFIPGESAYDDGMLHALLVSPRSITELVAYALGNLWHRDRLPAFGGHIKSDRIKLNSPDGKLTYTADGDTFADEEMVLRVEKKQVQIIPGARFNAAETSQQTNEVFKIQSLPVGETAKELSGRRLPLIKRASSDEFKDLFTVLRENASVSSNYLVLMVLSTALATLGLFANSSPVVIGAMILAPLMAPIISLSMASLRQDKKLVFSSASTILAGLGLAFAFAVFITWITPIHTANEEILARTSPNLLDLGIAVVSGIAGAYAHAREEVAKTLAGVAIAVALVPPLAVAGIGFGWLNWNIFFGASLLLFTNLAGMVLAGSVTFMILGFSPFRLATKGLFISLITVIVFSIPLALGFNRMLFEHKVVQKLDGWQTENITVRDVRVQSTKPLSLSLRLVTLHPLDDAHINVLKSRIEEKLDQKVELEISVALHR